MADPTTRLPSSTTSSTSVSRTTTSSSTAATPTGQQVEIAALMERYGWQPGTWQERLLQSADGAGSKDGKVSAGEVDKYLAAPTDGQFVSSSKLVQERNTLKALGGNVHVDKFNAGWERNLAAAADQLGYTNGKVTEKELETYIAKLQAEKGPAPSWFPDQKAAAFNSKIAEMTGEGDALRVGGDKRPVNSVGAPVTTSSDGVQVIKDYMRLSVDADTRSPEWVSYVMSAADIKVQGTVVRPSAGFHLDKEMPSKPIPRVTNGEYTLLNRARATEDFATPFDRGHMREAESSVNTESMYESFQTNNISPQYASLNQGAWRYLESATRELAMSSEGKVTVVTGNLYLGADGKPLTKEQMDREATTLGNTLAIPTHCFKTVLLEKPDGQKQMFAYVVPNKIDASEFITDVATDMKDGGWRVSVDQVEKLLGRDLYSHLDKATQAKLERDPAARAALVSQTEFKMANLFMGDGTYVVAKAAAKSS